MKFSQLFFINRAEKYQRLIREFCIPIVRSRRARNLYNDHVVNPLLVLGKEYAHKTT